MVHGSQPLSRLTSFSEELHQRGFCQSIEVWRDRQLIGGLYGVSIGRAFFGESMFSAETDGSKIALHWLCRQLVAWNFALIDCQVTTAHLPLNGVFSKSVKYLHAS